jgi:NhaP-type Na+/H+ or K+/H+ antiporter
MACILAPTDAALGIAIVQSPLVPQRIRDTLNVESGLNDGIALPPILALFVLVAAEGSTAAETQGWLLAMLQELIFGALVGTAIGQLGGRLLDAAWRRGWMEETFARLVSPGLAILAFSSANLMNLNGFVAAYLAGLTLGARQEEFRERLRAFGEADGAQFSLFVFLLFGLSFLPVAIPHWNGAVFLYTILSLTLVRMLPVALSLAGARLDSVTIAFIGWSGPRGIASILYLALVVDRFGLPGHETIFATIVLTVFLSIFLHGMSAAPLARAYGDYVKDRRPER